MKNRELSLVVRAFMISLVLNGVLLTIPSFFDPTKYPVSTVGKVVDALGAPGGVIVDRFFPGHDLTQAVIMLTCSVAFYAIVAWVVLSAWAAFRASRSPHESPTL